MVLRAREPLLLAQAEGLLALSFNATQRGIDVKLSQKFIRSKAVVLAAACAGCTAVPTVQYREIEKPADLDGVAGSFYLQRSVITVELKETPAKDKAAKPTVDFTVSSSPAEFRAVKYAIKPVNSWRSTTNVTLNKVANTDLVSSADVEVTDNTAKSINEYGGAIAKLIGTAAVLIAALPGADCLPAKSDAVKLNLSYPQGDTETFAGAGGSKCITVALKDLPTDALPRESIKQSGDTSRFYYAACRDAEVRVEQRSGPLTGTVRVADPRFVQFVQFPAKGSVSMHSACGVSVKTDKPAGDNTAAIVDALATQGKAIKDAIDAANK